jgi:glycosyl transferase family 25
MDFKKMKIFVINLPEDRDRRAFISQQLNAFGLEFELLPAIRGSNLKVEEKRKVYDRKRALLYRSRDLTNSDIGCSLSHTMVYQRMIEEDTPLALILEDDVAFHACFPFVLKSAEIFIGSRPRSVCLLSEAQCGETVFECEAQPETFRVSKFKSGVFAHCYLVDLKAAYALRKALFPVHDVADCWARLAREKVVDIFVAQPCASTQKREQFGSYSSDDVNQYFRGNVFRTAMYKMRRLRSIVLVDREPIKRIVGKIWAKIRGTLSK